ncbi:MAG: DUF418 domain-containing protein [Phycisphaerales bacterium]|nr:DUF418 domain-containing protein [Phycisphaerales bacterium]
MNPSSAQPHAGPILDTDRLPVLDVSRGFALLGILFVNASFFALPSMQAVETVTPKNESSLGHLLHAFIAIFCTGKFYPLFSILFGVGLGIMAQPAANTQRPFTAVWVRRMLMLALFGILHITLFWSGDILLLYAIVGICSFWLPRRAVRTLIILAAIGFSIAAILAAGIGLLTSVYFDSLQQKAVLSPHTLDQSKSFFENLANVLTSDLSTYDPRFAELETSALRDGPFLHALVIRFIQYLSFFFVMLPLMGPQVFACFALGIALLKSGFFHSRLPKLRRALIVLFFTIALPAHTVAYLISSSPDSSAALGALSMLLTSILGPLSSLGYLALILRWLDQPRTPFLARTIASLGRLGLTGYLSETVIMSFFMLHWGLGWYAHTTYPGRAALTVAVWLFLILSANLYLKHFRIGPLEWLWRTATYLNPPQLKRS